MPKRRTIGNDGIKCHVAHGEGIQETFFGIRGFNGSGGFDDCGNRKCLVYINATADRVNNFHGIRLLSFHWGKPLTEPLHIQQELKQFLVCCLWEQIICAWKMELTLINILFWAGMQYTTHLTVLCSITSLKTIIAEIGKKRTPFFITICAAGVSGGMEINMISLELNRILVSKFPTLQEKYTDEVNW